MLERFSRRSFSALLLSFGIFGAARARKADSASTPFEVALESNIRVRMRDGVRLATDVYRPARGGRAAPGRFPVILERTPYGKRDQLPGPHCGKPYSQDSRRGGRVLRAHGYVVIYQDCRGRYGSEGEFVKYLSDGADGFDTCAWIVEPALVRRQDRHHGALLRRPHPGRARLPNPPGVAAMFLDSGGFANAYQGGIRQGGAFELKQVTWAYNLRPGEPGGRRRDPACWRP